MNTLKNRHILLIITGGIAAYKSLDLIRLLREDGAKVKCILTDASTEFVTPLSVATLCGEEPYMDMFATNDAQRLSHINLSRDADMIVIAPTTADMMAKMRYGFADTLASAVLLAAADIPTLIAPAMNQRMWEHPATQDNLKVLLERGIKQIGPYEGFLACGEKGNGRMVRPEDIIAAIKNHLLSSSPLHGKKALVTSGPTYEPLDPVRFLGNRSSGKQGHAIAESLAAQGADVTLVTGPTALADPKGLNTIHVGTACEMFDACRAHGPFDIAVCAAAVADWRPTELATNKIKKNSITPSISLEENPDILASIASSTADRPALVIGFAAETDDVIQNAKNKFERKKCDWLIANNVGEGLAFGHDTNEVIILTKLNNGEISSEQWPLCTKHKIAQKLTRKIADFFSKEKVR